MAEQLIEYTTEEPITDEFVSTMLLKLKHSVSEDQTKYFEFKYDLMYLTIFVYGNTRCTFFSLLSGTIAFTHRLFSTVSYGILHFILHFDPDH